MKETEYYRISGKKEDQRLSSRILEETIQREVAHGHRVIEVEAFGQHGIGGRLFKAEGEEVKIRIQGHSGQRTGSLGCPNTKIEIMGPASDDIGWLNAGAEITVHGNASNGAMNGAAQGKVFIAGNIGARGMTMTKQNPRFAPPELWVLGSAGDYFGEFMAGGIAVICGHEPQNPESVLGYRPLVGMVGGKAFFRGKPGGYSQADAVIVPIKDADWDWLVNNITSFLSKIGRPELFDTLSKRSEWQFLRAKTPREKMSKSKQLSMAVYRQDVWDRELGKGGLIGDLQEVEPDSIPLITKGELRRYIPLWEYGKYKAPCQTACPTGIPVQERWHLIRNGLVEEALELGLKYTPFPASVCGNLCPSPCMASCTRNDQYMTPVNVRLLGLAGQDAAKPEPAPASGKQVAVLGAGPGGISAAWHLALKGHGVVLIDGSDKIGGKIASLIPESRIAQATLHEELDRVREFIPDIRLNQDITTKEFKRLKNEFDFLVVATGASKPRLLPVPGIEKAVSANAFLESAKKEDAVCGKRVVIIGAGNVGCDVATEAKRLGAETISMIDVQKPAAFGKEREDAEAVGATFAWPCFTREITEGGVVLQDEDLMEADTVVVSIGDLPDIDFLSDTIATRNGFIVVDGFNRTSDNSVFAIGDSVAPGLITDAIGAGKRAAHAIDATIQGKAPEMDDPRPMIDKARVTLEYFDPTIKSYDTLDQCGGECASCGRCRDCHICVSVCPESAIQRFDSRDGGYEYRADPDLCIGCGFCAGACPCGIWALVPNTPI